MFFLSLIEHTLRLSPHLLDLPLSEAIKGELESLFLDKLKKSNFTRLCSTRSMLLTVNESFPGLVIRIHRGDKVYVNVQNEGDYGVTIHWEWQFSSYPL